VRLYSGCFIGKAKINKILALKNNYTVSKTPLLGTLFIITRMKIPKLTFFACFFIVLVSNTNLFGQTKGFLKLNQRNPDGWFTLLVPKIMGKVQRHADVDGGFYITNGLEIDYSFWSYEGTPNWLRDVGGRFSKSPHLACLKKSASTLDTKIDGKRAIIQQCSETDEREGFRYIYYVTFPKVRVFNSKDYNYGMFNLSIEYKSKSYISIAERIIKSINFKR